MVAEVLFFPRDPTGRSQLTYWAKSNKFTKSDATTCGCLFCFSISARTDNRLQLFLAHSKNKSWHSKPNVAWSDQATLSLSPVSLSAIVICLIPNKGVPVPRVFTSISNVVCWFPAEDQGFFSQVNQSWQSLNQSLNQSVSQTERSIRRLFSVSQKMFAALLINLKRFL